MADENTPDSDLFDGTGNPDPDTEDEGAEGEAPKTEKPNATGDEDEPEIPVRLSIQQHIIARKNRQIEKLRNQQNQDEEDEDEDDLDDYSKSAVEKAVQKAIKPIAETLATRNDEEELSKLISSEPDAKKYERTIRLYMEHEAYRNVPPSVIYHHLAFGDSVSKTAKEKELADAEAAQNQSGGRQIRPQDRKDSDIPTPEELEEMSDEEFEALKSKAQQGKFIR